MLLLILLTIPLIASLASLAVRGSIKILNFLAIAGSLSEGLAIFGIAREVVLRGPYAFSVYFSVDQLGSILLLVVGCVGLAASWYSTGYLKVEVQKGIIGFRRVRQYFALLHLFFLAMFFATATANPILMWIAIEATTLSTAFLISFYNKPSALEAAWKYLVINSVGLLLGFFGTLLFLNVDLGGGLVDWRALSIASAGFDPLVAKIAFIFVLIGYGTKVGLVPMHTWRPDAYSKAPIPVVALFSGALLNVAFLAILRFKAVTDIAIGPEFSSKLLMFFGLISIVAAALNIFGQKNYKRLLAYSSIEHAGIMALGFGFGGAGAFAAILHMVYHALAKSILFLSAGNIFLKYSSTKMVNVGGLLRVLPATSVLFFIGFLAATGVPPFGIFLTEFSILASGIGSHPVFASLALLGMTMVFIGFLKHILAILFGNIPSGIEAGEMGSWTLAPIFLLAGALVVLSLFVPQPLMSLIISATSIY